MKKRVADYVMDFIAQKGVRHVFMLPGGGCMHLVDALGRNKKLVCVPNLHEQASAICADAYSQYTNSIGVCLVTTGPGGTNAITGVAASWIDSIPVMVISGQVKRADMMIGKGVRQMGPQEVDIVSMVKPVTKYAVTVMRPEDIRYHLEKAFYLAKTGRPGPVWIDIPLDIQGATIDDASLKGFVPKDAAPRIPSAKIAKVVALLKAAKRPVILAGNGVRLSGGLETFRKIIDWLGVPVLTTWKACDFLPEDHPLFFGRPGAVGQRGANFIQQNADLIISVGARLDFGQIGFDHHNFAPQAKRVVVDVDIKEIAKLDIFIHVKLPMDAGIFLNEICKHQDDLQDHPDRASWLKQCHEWKRRYPVMQDEYWKSKKGVNTYALVQTLSEKLGSNAVLVPGSSGSCSEVTMQGFYVKRGQRVLNSPGLGSMGFGIAASIGTCLASGKKETVCLIGDGGLQHNIQELELLKRYELPIKLFVLNNNAYASIRMSQERHCGGNLVACDSSSGLTLPDTQKIAKAYGLTVVKISSSDELKRKVDQVLNSAGPVICEVMIDLNMAIAPRMAAEVRPDGSIVSKPFEDLWPFLDRDEFKANMSLYSAKDLS